MVYFCFLWWSMIKYILWVEESVKESIMYFYNGGCEMHQLQFYFLYISYEKALKNRLFLLHTFSSRTKSRSVTMKDLMRRNGLYSFFWPRRNNRMNIVSSYYIIALHRISFMCDDVMLYVWCSTHKLSWYAWKNTWINCICSRERDWDDFFIRNGDAICDVN